MDNEILDVAIANEINDINKQIHELNFKIDSVRLLIEKELDTLSRLRTHENSLLGERELLNMRIYNINYTLYRTKPCKEGTDEDRNN